MQIYSTILGKHVYRGLIIGNKVTFTFLNTEKITVVEPGKISRSWEIPEEDNEKMQGRHKRRQNIA